MKFLNLDTVAWVLTAICGGYVLGLILLQVLK